MLSHFEPVVIHRGSNFKTTLFTGYAFNDVDLMVGAQGHKDWASAKKRRIRHHEDGCYMLAQPTPVGYEIGADYKGYCKIYIYRHLDEWAVSNSFSTLVEFAHSHDWPVTLNEHIFATHSFRGAFWQQSATFDTSVAEVTILPRTYLIKVTREGALTVEAASTQGDSEGYSNYAEALSAFQRIWVGRLGTTVRHTPNVLTAELTGGLDSRVVLSLLLSLRQHFPTYFSKQLFMKSNPTQIEDLQVATTLSKAYRLNLNKPVPHGQDGVETYDPVTRWWDTSLGSYTPIYFAPKSSTVGHFTVGGHGGEGHRSYWQIDSPLAKVNEFEKTFQSPAMFRAMLDSLESAQAILDAQYPGVPKTVAHYREFRDRIHSGLHAQNTVRLQPLSSTASYSATNLLAHNALERGQFLYDIIGNSAPGLLLQPFDKPEKAPNKDTLREITYANSMYPVRGSLYGAQQHQNARNSLPLPSWERLREAYNSALASAKEMPLPEGTIQAAEEAWKAIDGNGKLAHPRHSVGIQHVILSGLIDGTLSRTTL